MVKLVLWVQLSPERLVVLSAQIFLYWLGYYGGRPVVEKYGKYLLINKHHLDIAEGWFKRYGAGVIFSARFIPVVRHAISIPAGLAKMPLKLFTLYTGRSDHSMVNSIYILR